MPPCAGSVNLPGGAGNWSQRNHTGLTQPSGGSQAAGLGLVLPDVPIRGSSNRHFSMSAKVSSKCASAYVLILSGLWLDSGETPTGTFCGNQSLSILAVAA
jgi:hypothetical protein